MELHKTICKLVCVCSIKNSKPRVMYSKFRLCAQPWHALKIRPRSFDEETDIGKSFGRGAKCHVVTICTITLVISSSTSISKRNFIFESMNCKSIQRIWVQLFSSSLLFVWCIRIKIFLLKQQIYKFPCKNSIIRHILVRIKLQMKKSRS